MTDYRSSFVAVLVLGHFLAACSPTVHPAPDAGIVVSESHVPPDTSTIDKAASLEPSAPPFNLNISETGASAERISETGHDDERFIRPKLAIDHGIDASVPELLPDGAEVSYVIIDLKRGTPIAQHRADRDHIPASSAKLATAVVALQLLGPEHRFQTELRTTGPIEDGIVKGDVILKGGGDPQLDIPDLLPLIDDLARKHVRGIEGRFLIDDTLLPRFTEIEPTQPTEAAYNPGLSALSIAFNRVNLRWRNSGAFSVETVPSLEEASFELTASDRLPPGGVRLKQFDGEKAIWQLADKGARRSRRSLPVKDGGLYAGMVFADLARLYGIDLPKPERAEKMPESRLFAVHESKPLRDLVRNMLWYSNNLTAELIGLSAAESLQPEISSLETSAGIVLSELRKQLPEVSWDNAKLDNHSGLSSKARLTPEQLAAVLRYGWDHGMLSSALPGSGWSGTLAKRFSGPDQALRIWAKTGSINYVSTLGGYLLSSSHSPAAFVIMISDEKARATYDAEPGRTLASEKKARVWQRDAEEAMNHIVERWLEGRPSESLIAMSPANAEDVQ